MDKQSPIFWFDDHDISDAEMARLKEFVSEISVRVRKQERSRCVGVLHSLLPEATFKHPFAEGQRAALQDAIAAIEKGEHEG